MITIRIYAHLVIPNFTPNRPVDKYDWMAVDIAQNTTTLLAKMFKGKADNSTPDMTVQYDDTVIVNELSITDEEFIKKAYPFVSIQRRHY